jgi:RNA polymerase sigma-70 factor, ECF subfamily
MSEDSMNFCDEELMAMASSGSVEAFDMLYERYKHRLFAFAKACLKNTEDAEDAVQEVFIRICKSAKTYQPHGRFKSWIFQIAANRIKTIAASRKLDLNHEIPIEDRENDELDPERKILARNILDHLLSSLSPMQKMIVVLKEIEGMDTSVIATSLGLSPENVRVLLHRARNSMIQTYSLQKKDIPT